MRKLLLAVMLPLILAACDPASMAALGAVGGVASLKALEWANTGIDDAEVVRDAGRRLVGQEIDRAAMLRLQRWDVKDSECRLYSTQADMMAPQPDQDPLAYLSDRAAMYGKADQCLGEAYDSLLIIDKLKGILGGPQSP